MIALAPFRRKAKDEAAKGLPKNLTIRSSRGTVRGVKNRVRQGIATFLRDPSKKVGPIGHIE